MCWPRRGKPGADRRRAERLDGFALPGRSVVMIAPGALHRHRHRRLRRDPDAFDPSRCMPDAPAVPRFAYLPFGAGPRVCVRARFALTEAVLVPAMLVQRFRFAWEDTRPVLPVAIVITQPDHPAALRLLVAEVIAPAGIAR